MPIYQHRENKDRIEVYRELRRLGVGCIEARRVRDWTEFHIQTYLKANQFPELNIQVSPMVALRKKKEEKKVENDKIQ